MRTFLLIPFASLLIFSSCDVRIMEEPVPVVHDVRDHFTGRFEVEEYSETFDSYTYYQIGIVKAIGYSESVYLENFYGEGLTIFANVDHDHLYIPHQEIAGFHIEGEGFINGPRLELSYSVFDERPYHSMTDYCSAIAWR